jgi:hypothetical protein
LHKWGNPPSEIAKILGVHVEQIENILIALGRMKRPEKTQRPVPVMPRARINQMRKLDAEIKFHETRAESLRRYRITLTGLEQSGANLQQSINRATR